MQDGDGQCPGDGGGGEDSEKDCAANLFDFQGHHENEAEEGQEGGWVAQVAEADKGLRIADDQSGVAKADKGDEEANAAGYGCVEFMGDGAENHLTDAGGGER